MARENLSAAERGGDHPDGIRECGRIRQVGYLLPVPAKAVRRQPARADGERRKPPHGAPTQRHAKLTGDDRKQTRTLSLKFSTHQERAGGAGGED